MMQLRDYQSRAVELVYEHLRTRDDNPCVVIPTGGGKTPVIASICHDAVARWGGRVVILAHVKELLEQAVEKLRAVAPGVPVGVYSAGLGRRDIGYNVTIAGIQSVYSKAASLGPADLIIVDEAHMIPPDGEGMYRTFIDAAKKLCPHARVIGLTATPYRMKSGSICGPDQILNHVCFEVGVRELIVQGHLCEVKTKAGAADVDTSGLSVRGGEFVSREAEDLMDQAALVESACQELVLQTRERRAVLIFAAGLRHGDHIVETLRRRFGVECGFVSGQTPSGERQVVLDRFRRGELRYLCNVNVLTTGFDAPHIDCVVLLRPTMSPGVYYQMVGRGFRLSQGKTDCLVLDFGGNVLRHGPVDNIRVAPVANSEGDAPAKRCPECDSLIATGYAACPECGHVFPEPERQKHEATATSVGILSHQVARWDDRVIEVAYHRHTKRDDPDAPATMRAEYRVGYARWHREWVCFDHAAGSFPRIKASQWWRERSVEPVPQDVDEAVELARAGALAVPTSITVERKPGESYERIVGYKLGPKPPRLDDPDACPEYVPAQRDPYALDEDEVPF